MPRKNQRPDLFDNPAQHIKNMKNAIEKQTMNKVAKDIQQQHGDDVEVNQMPKYLQVTEARMDKENIFDMKPYFRRSPHAERSKDGGWYLRVPIRRKKSNMSRRMYEELRQVNIAPHESANVLSRYLYDKRINSDTESLAYTPKSNRITKRQVGNNRHEYTAIRTVSDKSDPSSWIMNRYKTSVGESSKTFVKNIDRLFKWRLKNLG